MKNEQGFSLVELLIVVAIIAIIAAIAIPSLLTSKMAANEAGAMQGCRTLGTAEIAYAATNNQNYANVGTLVTGNFVDSRFDPAQAPNGFNGYVYAPAAAIIGTTLAGAPPASFGFTATPSGTNGRYVYGIAPDQVVRFQATVGGAPNPLGLVPGDPIGKAQ